DVVAGGEVVMPLGTLHLRLETFLWRARCHRRLRIRNHGRGAVALTLSLHFRADLPDVFEVRGMRRQAPGQDLPPQVAAGRVVLSYQGLDGERRRAVLRFDPPPAGLTADAARYEQTLRPGGEARIDLAVVCLRGDAEESTPSFDDARAEAEAALE